MYKAFKYKIFPTEPQKELIAKRYLCMRSRGIWLTVLMRGVQLNSLTPSNGGTTAPISYTQCYKSGGGVTSGTMPYTGGAPPMLWTPPPLAYNILVVVGFCTTLRWKPKTLHI